MKILIILAPVINKELVPLGPAYLKSYVMQNSSHTVKIINLNECLDIDSDDDFAHWGLKENIDIFLDQNHRVVNRWTDEIMDYSPDILGFSCWYSTKWISLHIAKEIKRRNPDILTVFGGNDCSFKSGDYIEHAYVDIVVKGEGEASFLNIIKNFERKKELSGIQGTLIKQSGLIKDYGAPPEILDIDSIPFPDYSDLNVGKELPVVFVRGCRNSCSYCHVSSHIKNFRSRSAQSILDEIKQLKKKFPWIERLNQGDAGKLQDIGLVDEFCNLMIDEGLDIIWNDWSTMNPDVTINLLNKMRKAGCRHICWGVESGSQKILKKMGKRFSIKDAERLIRDTDRAGILAGVNFIVGFPGETEDDFNQTLQFINRNRKYIKGDFSVHQCLVLPMSRLHRFPEKYGLQLSASQSASEWEDDECTNSLSAREKKMQKIHSITGFFRISREFLDIVKRKYVYDDIKDFLQRLEYGRKESPEKGELYLYSGILLCNTGRYEQALQDLTSAMEWGIDSVNMHKAFGHACLKTGNYETGIRHLNRALELEPDNITIYKQLMHIYDETGEYEKSLECIGRLFTEEGSNAGELHMRRGSLMCKAGRYAEAEAELTISEKLGHDSVNMHKAFGHACLKTGNYETGIRHLNRALELEPDNITIYKQLMHIYDETGEYEKSLECIGRLFTEEGSSAGELHMRRGSLMCKTGRYAEAEAELTISEKLGHDSLNMHKAFGHACLKTGNYETGIRHLNRALELEPDNITIYKQLMHIYDETGEYEKSLECIGRLFTEEGSNAGELHMRRGSLMCKAGRYAEAEAELTISEKLGHDSVNMHKAFGHACLKTGNYEAGIRHLNRALELEPDNITIYKQLMHIYDETGEYEKSLECIDRLFTEEGSSAGELHMHRGSLLCKAGRYAEAEAELTISEKLGHDSVNMHKTLVHTYIKLGKYEIAQQHLKKSVDIYPNDLDNYMQYIMLYEEWGKNDLAFEYLNLIRKKFDQSSPKLDYLAGKLHFNAGDYSKSLRYFKSALESGYSQPDMDEMIRICGRELNT